MKNAVRYTQHTQVSFQKLLPLLKNSKQGNAEKKKIIFLHLDGCSETPSTSRTNTYTQTKAKNIYFIPVSYTHLTLPTTPYV